MAKIVLMGDSITEYMPYIYKEKIGTEEDEVKYFGVENIGVGSFTNYVWPHVDKEGVDTYYLLIGTNNISRPDCDYDNKETLEDLVMKIRTLIDMIIASKTGFLIVQSIYPTKHEYRIEDIKYVNKCIKEYCDVVGVEYLDMYSKLATEEDLFDERFTDDGIHPNKDGYAILAEEITKRLDKGMSIKLSNSKKDE